ncbi:hypothetical protein ACS0TY_004360 [Phlomoides rotata]
MYKDYIFRMKSKATGVSSPVKGAAAAGGWEMRPGGMLVQMRNSDSNQNSNPVPNIKVKVKYASSYHEVVISSQASFGELKKLLTGVTGLHTGDQKIIYKEKERDSKAFLDLCGVKDGSKMVVIEDELSRERRCVESRKNAKMEKASNEIAAIRFEVDKVAKQLIKLDGIAADGDVKLQRRMQVKRVQKYIETLDMLKNKNSGLGKVALQQQQHFSSKTFQNKQEVNKYGKYSERVNAGAVVVTTKWETF